MAIPFLLKVPSGLVPLIPRYYESLRLPTARLFRVYSFPLKYRSAPVSSLPCRGKCRPTWARGCSPVPHPGSLSGNGRISQVPEGPLCLHAVLFDPGRILAPLSSVARISPSAFGTASAPAANSFEAPSRGLHAPRVRLTPAVTRARATLGSGCGPALPGGIDCPLGSTERFPPSCCHYMLPPLPGFAWRTVPTSRLGVIGSMARRNCGPPSPGSTTRLPYRENFYRIFHVIYKALRMVGQASD